MDEIELLKRTVAKGTSDDEFKLFLWVCQKHKLDPLTRQIHCVMRWLNKHHQDEKGEWVGGHQMTIQIGIDGYRALAARDHADYGAIDEPEYEFGDEKIPGTNKLIPTKATIRLWKKGFDHPTIGVAYWDEYSPDLNSTQGFFWRKMPKGQLAKCAEAIAIRKAYPELSDIYTDSEMVQHDGHTPEGRQMYIEGSELAGGSREAAEAVAERRIKELQEKLDKQAAESPKLPAAPSAPQTPAPQPQQAATPKASGVPRAYIPPAGFGTLDSTSEGKTATGAPFMHIKLKENNELITTFDNKELPVGASKFKAFEMLRAAVGEKCVFEIEKRVSKKNETYWNITRYLKIGSAEWLEDGTPAVQRRVKTTCKEPPPSPFVKQGDLGI